MSEEIKRLSELQRRTIRGNGETERVGTACGVGLGVDEVGSEGLE